MRMSPADLRWWLDLAPTLEWTWAKTYETTAPHYWVALSRGHMSREDFVRAGHVIRTFGQPGRYYESTNIYLHDEERRWKWWTADRNVLDTDLVNRADASLAYGPQVAPSTRTPAFTEWDAVALEWDRVRDRSQDAAVLGVIRRHFGDYAPRTLDVGCGTGALLDLGRVAAAFTTAIDSSQGMLNELVFKYPKVGRVIPARFEDVPDEVLLPKYELVVAMDVPGVDVDRLRRLVAPNGLLVVT